MTKPIQPELTREQIELILGVKDFKNKMLASETVDALCNMALRSLDRPDDRLQRHGQNLFNMAQRMGWKDDGEGPIEFITRTAYATGKADVSPIDEALKLIPNGWYLERMFCFPSGYLVSLQTYRGGDASNIAQAQNCETFADAIRQASSRAIERDRE